MDGSWPAAEHEQGLALFLEPGYRTRWRDFLKDERNRRKLAQQIPNRVRLDPRFATRVDDISDAERRLLAGGAPSRCHVVAHNDEWDGREMPLGDALREVDYSGNGGFISCIPGRLGCFIDEWNRWVLERPE
jgi:hypothetical protein